VKTTNYYQAFIEVADDCPTDIAAIPPSEGPSLSAVAIQYDMISHAPYTYTSDDILFRVHQTKHDISEQDATREREAFFAKGQPCLRSSALGKRYGWGIHFDADGKVAIYARESEEYANFVKDERLVHLRAMRSKRK
jgi:hypothetical protein